jgi:DNA-binding response OmpR family regulator
MKTRKILIAEDDDMIFDFLRIVSQQLNITSIRANNGKEAVELFKTNNDFDLILMDIKMPIMDGYEATKNIRLIDDEIPIIAQTAHTHTDDRIKALNSGFNDYINKPIYMKTLQKILKKHLKL